MFKLPKNMIYYIFPALIIFTCTALFSSALHGKQSIVHYYHNNQLVAEKNPHTGMLSFLYQHPLGKMIRTFLRTRTAARISGWYYHSKLSRSSIQPFIDTYDINMDDYIVPAQGFASFNHFFARSLNPACRPLDQSPVICPTDGKVFVIPHLTPTSHCIVKDCKLNLESLLHDKTLASYYNGGVLFVIRLAPYDYHRFHFPVDGTPQAITRIPGMFESVNPMTYQRGISSLCTNERILIPIATERYGTVMMIAVGALFVGAITTTYQPQHQARGTEAGFFSFGGSTIVLIFPPNTISPDQELIHHSAQGFETARRFGTSLITMQGAL